MNDDLYVIERWICIIFNLLAPMSIIRVNFLRQYPANFSYYQIWSYKLS